MKFKTIIKAGMSAGLAAGAAAFILVSAAQSQMAPPFGNPKDIADAKALWGALQKSHLVGKGSISSRLYEGTPPHGAVLETVSANVTVNGHTGLAIVKKNYGPAGAKAADVAKAPGKHLGAVTVMFKREKGYDAEDKDWFWAKYLPDGSLDKNPKGMQLAGKVAKGMDVGCIACHKAAEGGDMVYTPINR